MFPETRQSGAGLGAPEHPVESPGGVGEETGWSQCRLMPRCD